MKKYGTYKQAKDDNTKRRMPFAYRINYARTQTHAQNINPLNAELNPICHLLVLLGDLTFICPCFVSKFQYISNKIQRYTVYIWKLLYMFRVVLPPIIRSAYNCIYSIWYLSQRYCYLPLSWKSRNRSECAVMMGKSTTRNM